MKGSGLQICLLFTCFFLLASCSKERNLPRGIFSVDKMSGILMDIQLAKSFNIYDYSDTTYPRDSRERMKILFTQVLDLHKTDTAQFFKSFRFYSEHPKWFKKVYTRMDESLKKKAAAQREIEDRRREAREILLRTPAYPWLDFPQKRKTMLDSLHHRQSAALESFQFILKKEE